MVERFTAAACWLALLLTSVSCPAAARESDGLDGETQCVPFRWLAGKTGPRGAISVPVTLNGHVLAMQLDTGSDATIIYGARASTEGWAPAGAATFPAHTLSIGSTRIDPPKIYVDASQKDGPDVSGTLGLPALVGKVSVIDFPGRRFCVFSAADVPGPLAKAQYVSATLRNAKLFIPVTVGDYVSDAIVFDTGSSELPLTVDLATWRRITGRADVGAATASYGASAWGKPLRFAGAPALGDLKLGAIDLGRPLVFTQVGKPDTYAQWPFHADGVLGNAPLWDAVLVLDLTARVRLGLWRPGSGS